MSATRVGSAWSCTVRLVVDDGRVLDAAADDLFGLLDRVDRAASRFRPDSALSVANARAGRPVPVPPLLVDLVDAALGAAADTDGAVDPTLGLAMQRIGYDRDITVLRSGAGAGADESTGSPVVGGRWRAVRLHREAGLLTVPRGVSLDLGSTAKAWTADHAARTLAARYGTAVLVELGGDVAVAGERDGGWLVRASERDAADGQVVALTRGGIATSTTTLRTWEHAGCRVHHLLDPQTSRPTEGPWRTATVHATSCLAANTASTAAIVLGDAAFGWLTSRGIAARLVHRDGGVVATPGWPREHLIVTHRPKAGTRS